jgi:hypothetical protein
MAPPLFVDMLNALLVSNIADEKRVFQDQFGGNEVNSTMGSMSGLP